MAVSNDVAVHIEELVLEGIHPTERQVVVEAVRRAIVERIVAGGVPQSWTREVTIPSLDLGTLRAPAGSRQLGRRVGEALAKGGPT